MNASSEALVVVLSHGELQPFEIASLREGVRLGLAFDREVTGPSCSCRCGYECLVCEPPQYREEIVEAGAAYEVRWPGWVRAWREGCHDPFALAPGTYTFKACVGAVSPAPRCETRTVQLPTDEVEFRFDG